MFHHSRTRTLRWYPVLVAAALSLIPTLLAPPAQAQLSDAQIADLRIQGQNEGWTFEVGPNPATERSMEELCGFTIPADWKSRALFDASEPMVGLPASYDWRTVTGCPPIRDQASCGSCWAFSTVGALECAIRVKDGIDVDLSEQWLVSCNADGWSCSGGFFAHDYHQWKTDPCGGTGAVLETSFPYTATNAPCSCPYPHPYRITSWAYIGNSTSVPSVAAMKQAILDHGPISISIYVDSAFQAYTGGVFNGSGSGTTNHAVVLVGWDDTQGAAGVWFLRNSWGPGWGENGYMRIAYGVNNVGYAACYVDYPGSDNLQVTPGDDLNSAGKPGGPFTPASKTYTLTNHGSATLNWTVGATQPWVGLSAAGGTLTAGATTTVDVTINTTANSLPAGLHADTVTFRNTTSGFTQTRAVNLSIEAPYPGLPFKEDFESGVFQPYWKVTGTNKYRSQVTTANGPHGGTHHLTMDCSDTTGSVYSRNEVTLSIDLAKYQNVMLSFWAISYADDPNGPPPSPFIGGADFDGVAVSADGTTWYEVRGLRDLTSSYAQYSVDLDAAIAAHGLAYNSNFKIRFNQYDNYNIPTDGIGIDDIQITGAVKDDLTVSPASGLASTGYQGGPFNPSHITYTLTNNGSAALNWTAGATQPWIDVSSSRGGLDAGASITVDVALNAGANSLKAGSYADTVTFTNVTSAVSQTRPVTLAIAGPCLPPPPPVNPDPADGATDLPVYTSLAWDLAPAVGAAPKVFGVLENTYSTTEDLAITRINSLPGLSATNLLWSTVASTTGASLRASYDVIYMSVNLGTTDYANLRAAVADGHALSDFALLGGVLVLNVAANQGNQADIGPGGCDFDRTYTHDAETFASATHPYIVGTDFGGTPLTTSMFNTWSNTDHGDLLNLPAGATSILLNANGVSMAEYPWGTGKVIVSTLTFGWSTATTFSGPPLNNELLYAAWHTTACHTTYDVYFGTDNPPATQIASDLAAAACNPGILTYATTYHWKVVAKTDAGPTPGPVWSFTTKACLPPPPPANPTPADGAPGVSVSTDLAWADGPALQAQPRTPAERQALLAALGDPAADPQRQGGLPTVSAYSNAELEALQAGTVKILAFTAYSDNSATGEYNNTINAIAQYFPNFTVTTTTAQDAATLTSLLAASQVFLMPEQENWSTTGMQTFGTNVGATLRNFVSAGGLVIVCDYSPSGGAAAFLNAAGLMNVTWLSGYGDHPAKLVGTHPITNNVSAAFTVMNGATTYSTVGDATALVADVAASSPMAAVKSMGAGSIVLLGWDFYSYNSDMARIIANAVQSGASGPGCGTTYDVYFGTDNPPTAQIAADLPAPTCNPGPLAYDKTYYWKVVAKSQAGPTDGPVWQFATQGCPPPPAPDLPSPADNAKGVAVNTPLAWSGNGTYVEDFNDGLAQDWQETTDPQWSVVSGEYKAAAGTTGISMQSVYTGQVWQDCYAQVKIRRTGDSGSVATLFVRATDDFNRPANTGSAYAVGISGMGDFWIAKYVSGVWTPFQGWTTSPYLNLDPAANVVGLNVQGSNIKVYFNGNVAWSGTDSSIVGAGRVGLWSYSGVSPETISYFDDVTVTNPLAAPQGEMSALQGWYNDRPLSGGSEYAAPPRDSTVQPPSELLALETPGQTPAPLGPQPAQCPVTYDVYFGTDNPPSAMIAGDLTVTTCDPGPLAACTTYYWKVVAKNVDAQTEGPVWSFRTASPPVATPGKFFCQAAAPLTITLQASDDGAPTPPAAMTRIITSLPVHGSLSDPGAGAITSAPYTLANRGTTIVYTPDKGYGGCDSFNFKANDGGAAPSGGDSNSAIVVVTVAAVLYAADMTTDPGWTLDPGWAWGTPTGGGSHNLDPTSGHTGANVIGYNLAGDYQDNIPATRFATLPAINCRGYGNVNLAFYRWLGIESSYFDHAAIEVSSDGVSWTEVWANSIASIADTTWQYQEFDLSAAAADKATVYIRFGLGPTDSSDTYPGWNIDDVMVTGLAVLRTGDVDGDGCVDVRDLLYLVDAFGTSSGNPLFDARCDFNNDGAIDVADLLDMVYNFGT